MRQKRPATDGFLQIATYLNLIMEFDYEARTLREAKEEFAPYFESILKGRKSVTIRSKRYRRVFAMHALRDIRARRPILSPLS